MKVLILPKNLGSAECAPEHEKLALAVGFQPTVRLTRINSRRCQGKLAPAVGFEPTTNRLTADRSTTELRWILFLRG
jgi:hypothetical protein